MNTIKKLFWSGLATLTLGAVFFSPLLAAQEIVQGYTADGEIRPALIVGLAPDSESSVRIIDQDQESLALGVTVDASDAPFALSDESSDVFVATVGNFSLLVSDDNGPVKTGDYLSVSTVAGIAQKATTKQEIVVGKALEDFVPLSGSEVFSQVEGQDGRINIGRIKVEVSVGANPTKEDEKQNVPDFLKTAGDAVASKPVSAARIYVAIAIIFITAALAGSIVYAAVRSGITAIGRNPLSRKSITRSLVQSVLVALIVLIGGLFMAFLTIRFS